MRVVPNGVGQGTEGIRDVAEPGLGVAERAQQVADLRVQAGCPGLSESGREVPCRRFQVTGPGRQVAEMPAGYDPAEQVVVARAPLDDVVELRLRVRKGDRQPREGGSEVERRQGDVRVIRDGIDVLVVARLRGACQHPVRRAERQPQHGASLRCRLGPVAAGIAHEHGITLLDGIDAEILRGVPELRPAEEQAGAGKRQRRRLEHDVLRDPGEPVTG